MAKATTEPEDAARRETASAFIAVEAITMAKFVGSRRGQTIREVIEEILMAPLRREYRKELAAAHHELGGEGG